MKLFSFHNEIKTNCLDEDILNRLTLNTEIGEPTMIYGWKKPELMFRGKLKNNTFNISRTFRGNNFLSPLISGKYEGGKIYLHFGLFPFVKVFLYLFGLILSLTTTIVLIVLKNYNVLLVFLSAQVGLLLIFQINFWFEYKRSYNDLNKIINEP